MTIREDARYLLDQKTTSFGGRTRSAFPAMDSGDGGCDVRQAPMRPMTIGADRCIVSRRIRRRAVSVG
jgi:hypothetical protein